MYRYLSLFAGGLLLGGFALGCAAPEPVLRAAETSPDSPGFAEALSAADREALRQAFDQFAQGRSPVRRLAVAQEGIRWSDIQFAVPYAADDAEMAVIERRLSEQVAIFELRTVDDKPVHLEIRRTKDDRIYEISRLDIGWVSQDAPLEEVFRSAIHHWMLRFGLKRQLSE